MNVTWDLFWDRIQIDYDAWDTHTKNFSILKENKLPHFDQTFTALLDDLDRDGLLDETLVVVMSEMGRTPQDQRHRPAAITGPSATRCASPARVSRAERSVGASMRRRPT